jgi:hypothetical protein
MKQKMRIGLVAAVSAFSLMSGNAIAGSEPATLTPVIVVPPPAPAPPPPPAPPPTPAQVAALSPAQVQVLVARVQSVQSLVATAQVRSTQGVGTFVHPNTKAIAVNALSRLSNSPEAMARLGLTPAGVQALRNEVATLKTRLPPPPPRRGFFRRR